MQRPINLYIGTTNLYIDCSECHSSRLNTLERHVRKKLLSYSFQPMKKRYMPDKMFYNICHRTQSITVPIGYLQSFKDFAKSQNINVEEIEK